MGDGEAGLYTLADTRPGGYTLRELLTEAARAMGGNPRFLPIPAALLLGAGKVSGWWGGLRGTAPIFTVGKARELLHTDWSVRPEEALPSALYQENIGILRGFPETVAWYKAAKWLA